MKEIFESILQKYKLESENNFAKNSFASYIRNDVPQKIFSELQLNKKQFRITASSGQGNWASIPWIGIFDIDITNTATKGYDVVYLFRADMSGVYLSLNQGWTYFKEKYGLKEGKLNIQKVSNSWKKILTSTLSEFSFEPIDLKCKEKRTDLPFGYELGHICGKYYDVNAIPDNQVILEDLRNMMSIYRELKGKMRGCSTEKTNNYILAGEKIGLFDIDDNTDKLNNIIANSADLSITLEKPPTSLLKPKSNILFTRKTNHMKKQIRDTKIGLVGEKIIIEYEKERLINEGCAELIKFIKHVSQEEGDGAGYDILSYDKDGNERYIEVKTTLGERDSPFIISDNEVQFSINHSLNYYLYRVYNLNAQNMSASLYIINGDLTHKFHFKAKNYISSEILNYNKDCILPGDEPLKRNGKGRLK